MVMVMLFIRIVGLFDRCFLLYLDVGMVGLGMLKLNWLICNFVLIILVIVFVKDCWKFGLINVMCIMFLVL